jgi:DNA-binding NtrC family response regulator
MPPVGASILVVDDDPDILDVLADRLEALDYRVVTASTGRDGLARLEDFGPQLVLLDIALPDMNGLDVLTAMRTQNPTVTVVMITAYGTVERAVQAMKQGAYDFVLKPFAPDHLRLIVQKALEWERLRSQVHVLAEVVGQRYHLVGGQSTAMQQALAQAQRVARSQATVLLLGESGTGKELFAHAIHDWSPRQAQPFIAVNCVALTKELLESELFGHEKGAFTGATQLKKGKVELAQGGTVFLDEIGDIPLELQSKLLRFLQEREIERVGGTRTIPVDTRIIAATNRDLPQAIRAGHFRADLYYRLNVVALTLPPLRARREDIPALAAFFLQHFAAETKKPVRGFTPEVHARFLAYAWPGNVRELANVIERAVVLGEGPDVTLPDLPLDLIDAFTPRVETPSLASPPLQALSYHDALAAFRRDLLRQALAQAQGNHTAAAQALGLQRTYFQRLLTSLGLR